jgi:ribonuclease R
VGESFAGTVSGVTSFGLFVALDEVFVEGLLHVTELGSDYFHYDAVRHEMLGERTGMRYRLGDRLRVKVARVDMETSKIDFVLDQAPPGRESTPGGKTAKMPAAKSAAKSSARSGAGGRSSLALPRPSKDGSGGPTRARGKSKSKSTRSRKGSKQT